VGKTKDLLATLCIEQRFLDCDSSLGWGELWAKKYSWNHTADFFFSNITRILCCEEIQNEFISKNDFSSWEFEKCIKYFSY
jgi:hypothetical protein